MNRIFAFIVLLFVLSITACDNGSGKPATNEKTPTPTFTLAWSEYPSWSVFGVAHEKGLINGKEGQFGSIELKYNVDIVLKLADYDTCITQFASKTADAACLTNMDILAPAMGRDSVVFLPTSTSVGADACIVVGVETVNDLKGKKTYGLEKTVAQFAFVRNLQTRGLNPDDYPFSNMDPAAAAQAMQTNQANIQSIQIWNPFVLETLRKRDGAKVLFDSSSIPEEIIDCVVIGKDSLQREGGERFAKAVVETFYEINKLLNDPKEGDSTLLAIGEKFSNLNLEDMKLVVKQTKFYENANAAKALFGSEKFKTKTMPIVVGFCEKYGVVDKSPTVGFDNVDSQVNFTTKYLD